MTRVFLWDIDGTLVATGGAGLRALERAVKDLHGVDGGCAGIRADGKTDPLIVSEIFELHLKRAPRDGEMSSLIEHYLGHLRVEVEATDRYRVMPGVFAAL